MGFKEKSADFAKDVFAGRKFSFFDNLFFSVSKKMHSGWSLGNIIRNAFYGKRNFVSREEIIFIGGAPRSGTSLMQNLMRSFRGIDGPYMEICLFQDIKNKDVLKEFLVGEGEFREMWEKSGKDIVKMSESIVKAYKKKKKIDLVVVKAPKYALFVDEIFRHFPNSLYINMLRDGRDASISMKGFFPLQTKKSHSFSYCIKTWVVSVNRPRAFRDRKNYMEVRYEKLVENPTEIMGEVAKFIGRKTPKKKDILNFFTTIDSEEVGKLSQTHKEQLSKPVYKTSVGKWKGEMSYSEKKEFKRLAGDVLIKEGYEKDNKW